MYSGSGHAHSYSHAYAHTYAYSTTDNSYNDHLTSYINHSPGTGNL